MQSALQTGKGEKMDQNQTPNQAPKRPGGEMKGTDSSQPSKSQLLPFTTNAMELTSKPYFIPGLIVAILVPMLFTFLATGATIPITFIGVPVNVPMYTVVMAFVLTAGGAYAINRMVGKPRVWWLVPSVVVLSAVLLDSPVWGWLKGFFAAGFNGVDPGDAFLVGLFKAVISIGFPEELIKAIPVFIGVYIGRKLLAKTPANHPTRQFAVVEPLDGILIGAAAGLGFAFNETLFEYIPRMIYAHGDVIVYFAKFLESKTKLTPEFYAMFKHDPVKLFPSIYAEVVKLVGPDEAAFQLNRLTKPYQSQGIELLLPRLLGNVTGHSAYSGIFGYFIGLAAMKPQNWLKTVLIGLCIAAGLHGFWDTIGHYTSGPATIWYIMISLAAFFGMATLIMKAREITPNRSQLVASQIIDRMAAGMSRSQLVPQGFAQPGTPMAPSPVARPPSTPVPAHSITYDDGTDTLMIEIGSARVPVALGTRLFERQAPGTRSSRGDSVIGEINANPKEPDVLGIKNLSAQIWHVTTQDGDRRELVPGRSVRLMRGMRILVGDLYAEIK